MLRLFHNSTARTCTLVSLFLLTLLTGCSGFVQAPPSSPPTETGTKADAPVAALSPPAAEGKFYLDDGPPVENLTTQQLAAIPDAVVRAERINPAHNRPYVVLGKRYVPFTDLRPYRQRGVASWYGKRYHGRQTASGEIYDMHKMTAAHPILPIPSYVRVTNEESGDSVIVRINDRGPFLQRREIDLSYVAAVKLGIAQAGTGAVLVELLLPDDAAATPSAAATVSAVNGAATAPAAGVTDAVPLSDEVYIQLAAFRSRANAGDFMATVRATLPAEYHAHLMVYEKGAVFAVQLGPYADHAGAAAADTQLCERYQFCGFLTQRYTN